MSICTNLQYGRSPFPRVNGFFVDALREGGRGVRCIQIILLILSTFLSFQSAQAQERQGPRVVLIVADTLRFDDFRNPSYPDLQRQAESGATGLMNVAVPNPKGPTTAMLTLATGQPMRGEPGDERAANDWEQFKGDPTDVRSLFQQQNGEGLENGAGAANSMTMVRHLGWPGLVRRGISEQVLGALLGKANPPITTFICGNADTDKPNRRAALLTLNATGQGMGLVALKRYVASDPFGLADDPIALIQTVAEHETDFVVVQLGDTARAEAARSRLTDDEYHKARDAALKRLDLFVNLLNKQAQHEGWRTNFLIISPTAPPEAAGATTGWQRLTPLVAWGPNFAPGLFTSPTTRTTGLVANIDFAPTLLSLFHASVPNTMIGRVVRSVSVGTGGAERVARLARQDWVAELNGRALALVVPMLAAVCFGGVLIALAARRSGNQLLTRRLAPVLVFTLNLGAAAMLAPILPPPTLTEYALRIVAWMVGLTVVSYLLARVLPLTPPVTASLLTLALVAGDTLAGQSLLKESVLSGYALSGIRYYGVGNEYLGIVLGCLLAGGFALLDDCRVPFPVCEAATVPASLEVGTDESPTVAALAGSRLLGLLRLLLFLLWIGFAVLLGWPGLGANAGSLASAGAGFAVGAFILCGRKAGVLVGIAGVVVGLALAFGFGFAESALTAHSGGGISHIGGAVQAATTGRGAGYLVEIAARKVAMNLRLLATVWTLLGVAIVSATLFAARLLLGPVLVQTFASRHWQRSGTSAIIAAGIAALLFKDSGVVTVGFLVGTACLIVLFYPLTSGLLDSALPNTSPKLSAPPSDLPPSSAPLKTKPL